MDVFAPASYVAVILLSLEAFVLLLIRWRLSEGCGMARAGCGSSCRRCLSRCASMWRCSNSMWSAGARPSSRR